MKLSRRRFLSASLAGLSAAALPSVAAARENTYKQAFAEALQKRPYLSAYQSASQEVFEAEVNFKGHWPKALQGRLFRNGPARHEIGDFRYQHWFDGDGMVHRYELDNGKLRHLARMIETTKYQAEKAAGRAMYPGFGTLPDNAASVSSPDLVNVGNISVLPHHGKLLALWEAGSPWEINTETMETKGLHQFSSGTRGVPFSAHPRVEPDGTMWNFGYWSRAGLLILWHIDKHGKVKKMGKLQSEPMTMPHDFVVTRKHIVLLMPPLHYKNHGNESTFIGSHEWHPDLPTRVLVVNKADFNQHRWLELPSQWVFHFGNAFEDKKGVIFFDGARAKEPAVMTKHFGAIMRGEILPPSPSQFYRYKVDTKNWTVAESEVLPDTIDAEFPVIDPRVSTERHNSVVMMTADTAHHAVHQRLNQVSRFDYDTGALCSFRYPDSQIPEEHLFVPAPKSQPESKGWVIGTAHNWHQGQTTFNVFDFSALDAGPVATAELPYGMPLGLHGKFVQA